jgi:integrase
MASIVDRHTTEPDKQGGKRWQVRWRDDRNKDRRKAFEKRAEADQYLARIQHELNTGSYRDPRAGHIPFDEYTGLWLQSQVQLRPSTYQLYEGIIRNHLVPFLGSMPLNRITAATGRELLTVEMPERAKGVAVQLLKRITGQAAADMLLPHNPLQSLKAPKEPRREANFLTIPELNHLVSHVHPHFQTLVLVAGFLGLRQGELFGLHPSNVALEDRQIRVVEQLLGNASTPTRAELKTRTSRRTVGTATHLIGELTEQLEQRASTEFVFTALNGGPIRKSNFNRRYWQPATKAAGLEGFRFHELRHTAASIAIQSNTHPRLIQEALGHSSIKVTMDRYGHLMPGADQTLANNIDQLIAAQDHLSDDVVPLPTAGLG